MKHRKRLLANLMVALLLCALPVAGLAEAIDNGVEMDAIVDLAIPSEADGTLLDIQELDGGIVLDGDIELEDGGQGADPGQQSGQGISGDEPALDGIVVDQDAPAEGQDVLPEDPIEAGGPEAAEGAENANLVEELVIDGIVETDVAANDGESDFVIEDGVLKKYNGAGGEVTIPEGVTTIGEYAFQDCTALTKVELPKALTTIEYEAFYGCTGLESISIPGNVKSLGTYAFYGCSNLASITLADDVTGIEDNAFWGCPAIRYANIGSSVAKELGKKNYDFREPGKKISLRYYYTDDKVSDLTVVGSDKGITTATIPKAVTAIGANAFVDCTALTKVEIPEAVTAIGEYAFQDCSALTEVELPKALTTIEYEAFYGCTGLESISIPGTVKSLGSYVFYGCSKLASITLADGVTGIESNAFSNCPAIRYANIGSSVAKELGKKNYDFREPGKKINLMYYITDGKVSDFAVVGADKGIKKAEIPDGVKSINAYAFEYCDELTGVTIPASVKTIDDDAFYGLSGFTITTPCKSAAHTFAKKNNIKFVLVHDYDNDGVCTRCKLVRYTEATAEGYSGTYDGKAHGLTVTVTTPASGGTVKYGTKSGSCTKSALTYANAGTYTIFYEAKADGYAAVSGSAEVSLKKKTVGLKWTNTSLTYSGANQKPTATATGLVKGDKCTVTVDGAKKDAGSYTAKATKLSNANYALPKTATKKYTIKPLTAELKWTNTSLTYSGANQKPKATVGNLVKGDKCTVTVGGAKKDAGTYTAKATKLSNANYALPEAASKKYTINPLTVGLTWKSTSLTYNGKSQKPTATATGLIKGDKCTVTVGGAKKDAGSYTAKATKLSNANYALPEAASKKYTIKPLTVKLAWSNTTLTYNGKNQKPTAKVSNLVKGDKCTVTVSGAKKDAGTYTATATKLSNANYALPKTASVKYTIKPRTAKLAWTNTRFTYDGKSHKPTATVSNLVKGDACTVTVDGAKKAAGTYTATATKLSNANYALPKKATVKFTIEK